MSNIRLGARLRVSDRDQTTDEDDLLAGEFNGIQDSSTDKPTTYNIKQNQNSDLVFRETAGDE